MSVIGHFHDVSKTHSRFITSDTQDSHRFAVLRVCRQLFQEANLLRFEANIFFAAVPKNLQTWVRIL